MLLVWTVRWGSTVIATGTGPLPPEYGLPQPRVSHGDVAVVRSGAFTAEVRHAPLPPRAARWGAPDVHFLKVLAICVMALAAVLVLVRERFVELQAEKVAAPIEERDVFAAPRFARYTAPHRGFTVAPDRDRSPIAKRDLDRIARFPEKVKQQKARDEALASSRAPAAFGVLTALRTEEPLLTAALVGRGDDIFEGGEVAGVVGGLGLRGSGEGGGGNGPGSGSGVGGGGIGLGRIGIIGRGSGGGSGSGFGAGGLVSLDRVRVEAELPSRRIFMAARSRVMSCLGGFTGEMVTDVYLSDDGQVQRVSVAGPPEAAKRCVAQTIERLSFPGGDDHVWARWTTG